MADIDGKMAIMWNCWTAAWEAARAYREDAEDDSAGGRTGLHALCAEDFGTWRDRLPVDTLRVLQIDPNELNAVLAWAPPRQWLPASFTLCNAGTAVRQAGVDGYRAMKPRDSATWLWWEKSSNPCPSRSGLTWQQICELAAQEEAADG